MLRWNTIAVKHNIEVAHRLLLLPGKCENIHGHSMWITLQVEGELNKGGVLAGIEFGDLKKVFRGYLDSEYDHHLLLNQDDPFANGIGFYKRDDEAGIETFCATELPGLKKCPNDPTTENIANWVANWMDNYFVDQGMSGSIKALTCEVWETSVNNAAVNIDYTIY